MLHGFLATLHIKLDHPSRHQLKQVTSRHFFALDLNSAIEDVTNNCHVYSALQSVPSHLLHQTISHPPETVGVYFAADVM